MQSLERVLFHIAKSERLHHISSFTDANGHYWGLHLVVQLEPKFQEQEKPMKNVRNVFALTMALAAITIANARPFEDKDIVDTAVGAGKFTTLVKLVQAAGLVDTLKGAGPFTVLAPTDDAFAKLPKALVSKVMGDKELLKKILLYHVISGSVKSTDLKTGTKAKTVEGEQVKIKIKDGSVYFNKSKVVIADVIATNGVIHAIDTVLLPPSVAPKHHKMS